MDGVGYDPACAFAERGRSVFQVQGADDSSAQDEVEHLRSVRAQMRIPKTHRLSRKDPRPLPTIEVEYHNLCIQADALVGSAGNPSVLNSCLGMLRLLTLRQPPTTPHSILAGVSGMLKPTRMTLLLGPPAGGKSLLLAAFSGRLRTHRHCGSAGPSSTTAYL